MSKTLILGDIHGRTIWQDIITKENPDKIIFLGDYVSTHDDITSEQQCSNLEDILNYKKDNIDKVILLRGNHDDQHLGYYWAQCSGFDKKVSEYLISVKNTFLDLTKWVHIENNVVYSHAGISKVWLNNVAKIDDVTKINDLEPSEIFGFWPDSPLDYSGYSTTQPPTWIRPSSLATCNITDYDQVVGHTPVFKIVNIYKECKGKRNIWLCDSLDNKEYLLIEDSNFNICKL